MSWSEIFKSKETKAAEQAALEASIRQKVADEAKAEAERVAKLQQDEEERIEQLRIKVEADWLAEKMNSTTPWFEAIIGMEDATFVHERYRWNQAFIKDLIKKGIAGESDNEVVQAYLDKQVEDERKRVVEEERDKKRNSPEPWVEVVGENIDSEGRIELQLDWNIAFVKYLRQNGFRGATDDILVQQWLAALQRDATGDYE